MTQKKTMHFSGRAGLSSLLLSGTDYECLKVDTDGLKRSFLPQAIQAYKQWLYTLFNLKCADLLYITVIRMSLYIACIIWWLRGCRKLRVCLWITRKAQDEQSALCSAHLKLRKTSYFKTTQKQPWLIWLQKIVSVKPVKVILFGNSLLNK